MFSNLYDKGSLVKYLFCLFVTFGLMQETGGAGFAIVIPMVFYCLLARKVEGLMFWLLVAVCALIVNPHIVAKGGGFPWMQRGLMIVLGVAMTVSSLAYPMHKVLRSYSRMIYYIAFMAISSAYGWNPKIAYLKLILFMFVYFSYLGVSNQVGINSRVSSREIRSVMLSIAILFVIGSVALYPFPGLSQMRAEDFVETLSDLSNVSSRFMGMANHSQCLGPIVSSVAAILLSDLLFSIKKADLIYILLLVCCPFLVYLTSSRTGMGAYVLGQAFVIWVFMNARGVASTWKSKVMTISMAMFTVILLAFTCVPAIQRRAAGFILKRGEDDARGLSITEVVSSRQALMDVSIKNFKKSPLIGNGFQVSEEMETMKTKGLAILSAPIEKGVWVTAVLEEGGVIGWIIFVVFLFTCIINSIKHRAYMGASCLFVCILTNLGEFTFFSMSYTGGFTWAMVFLGVALDLRKMGDENEAMRKEMMLREMEMQMEMARG